MLWVKASFCELCGNPGFIRCRSCGRIVCSSHIGDKGLCVACLDALCRICGTSLSVGRCNSCLRLVCINCSIQLDPVRRICRECMAKGFLRGGKEVNVERMIMATLNILKL